MDLNELRSHAKSKVDEYHGHLKSIDEDGIQHYSKQGEGPLTEITDAIKQEYRNHIETYAALIAEIDALLGA